MGYRIKLVTSAAIGRSLSPELFRFEIIFAALGLLSLGSALGALCLFYCIALNWLTRLSADSKVFGFAPRLPALLGTIMLAVSYLFVRQAGTQEVYSFHALLVFLSILPLLVDFRRGVIWSGVLFGLSTAAHQASIFLARHVHFNRQLAKKKRASNKHQHY